MSKKTEQTKTFEVIDEAGGSHTIIEFTNFTDHRPSSGPSRWLPGSRFYETAMGEDVEQQDDGTYLLVDSGQILRPIT